MESKRTDLQYLEKLLGENLPESIYNLPEETLADVVKLVKRALEIANQGVDKAFEMTSVTIKFIPNFIIFSLIHSYIEPAIAARLTKVLTHRQVLDIASGLKKDYIGETLVYMEEQLASELLQKMKVTKAKEAVEVAYQFKPLKVLDILARLGDDLLLALCKDLDKQSLASLTTKSKERLDSKERLLRLLQYN
ncbi:MAG: hypothetical protein AAF518_15250 [Spirochaetota bacterium]